MYSYFLQLLALVFISLARESTTGMVPLTRDVLKEKYGQGKAYKCIVSFYQK